MATVIEAENVLGAIAIGQWGLFTTAQAVAAGVSRTRLGRLEAAGAITRVRHGVYAARAAAGEHQELQGAWLALDPRTPAHMRLRGPDVIAASHASAALLHGFGDLPADRHEFTAARRLQTSQQDLRLHRGELPPQDVTLVSGLPVTTAARTVADLLADRHDGDHVAAVLAEAVRAGAVDLASLAGRLAPYARRYGLPAGDGQGLLDDLLDRGAVAESAAQTLHAALTRPDGALRAGLLSGDGARLAEIVAAVFPNTGSRVDMSMLEGLGASVAAAAAQGLAPQIQLPAIAELMRQLGPQAQVASLLAQLSPTALAPPGLPELLRALGPNIPIVDYPWILPNPSGGDAIEALRGWSPAMPPGAAIDATPPSSPGPRRALKAKRRGPR
jgi:predicted transcriptional regulator of viral defense system